jgi:hypothetical protein
MGRSGNGKQRSVNSIDPTQADGEASADDTTPLAPATADAAPVAADEAEALAFDDATIDELLEALGPDPHDPAAAAAEESAPGEMLAADDLPAAATARTEFVEDAAEPLADTDATVLPPTESAAEFAVQLDEGVDQDAEALEDAPTAAEALEAVFGDCAIVPPRHGRPALAEAVAELSEDVVDAIDATLAADVAAAGPGGDPELHAVLGELRDQLATRSEPSTEALTAALRDGFTRTQQELAQTNANLANLTAQLATLQQTNLQLGRPVRVVLNGPAAAPAPLLPPRPLLLPRDDTTPTVIVAMLLMLSWAGLLWWKTGDARVAIATAAAANVLACFAFFGRRHS